MTEEDSRRSGPGPLAAVAGHAGRAREERASQAAAERVSRRLSAGRLVSMLLATALGVFAWQGHAPVGTGWVALSALVAFVVLVACQSRVERRIGWHDALATWHEERVHRLGRAWSRLPPPWSPDIDPHHPFSGDLDLFGQASVFQLIGPPATQAGRAVLAAWLLTPARPDEIVARQEAVRELAVAPERREQVAAHAALVGRQSAFDLGVFLDWAEGSSWLLARPWLVALTRLLAAATPSLLVAVAVGVTDRAWWLATLALGLVLSWVTRREMDRTLGRAIGWEPVVRAYVAWLRLVESAPATAPYLTHLHAIVAAHKGGASRQIARFQRLVALVEFRHTALLHLPVHALTLWDFHVWWALDRWRRDSGRQVRAWIDALGVLEALVNVATLSADHPQWAMPGVVDAAPALEARALGHPLLPPAACVRNDVRIGPPGRVLCITGSNMSGKSTLLRAAGVNAVLAQAGAPVCADAFTMPPVEVYTSLRVVDSLAEGVSFFMAALERLREVVRAADRRAEGAMGPAGPRRVLYLLDEILQGTNSAERETAVRLVLHHLLQTPAIGAITTHDLALTATPELASAGDHVHFRETIVEDVGRIQMSFDYKLRPGVATSRNALALLRLVGLANPDPPRVADRAGAGDLEETH